MSYKKNIQAFEDLKKQSKPDAIIFDWDNTLVDTWPLIHKALNMTMREFNREEWSFQQVKNTVHKSMRESFPEIFGKEWEKAGAFYLDSYRKINIEEIFFLNGAQELIKIISQKNIPQFVVSNKMGTTLRKEAQKLEISNEFFCLVGAGDANFDKPDLAPVEFALSGSEIEINKNNIWFVGDTIADVDCAYNCGAVPIIFGHENEISKTIPTEIYENGKNQEGAIPTFFDHFDFVKLIEGF